jgi:hypothetical protein
MLSYASVYVEADRAASRYLSDPTYKILHNLVSRADEYGICWPGIRTIAEDTGKGKDTVQAALEELEFTGCITYIRRNGRDPITKKKINNVYQINPRLYAIRPGLQAQAEACWQEHGGKPLSFPFPSVVSNHNRTNFNQPPSGTSYLNQQQQKPSESERSLSFPTPSTGSTTLTTSPLRTSPPAQPDEEEEKTDEYFDYQPGAHEAPRPRPNSNAKQQRSKNQVFRRSNTTANKSDGNSTRTPYPTIERITEELPNQPEEWLADRCRRETGMSIRFARGLIKHYSGTKVEAALNDKSLRGSTSIKNKAGYVFWLLVNGFIEPASDLYGRPDDPDGSRYITGKYADIIEH